MANHRTRFRFEMIRSELEEIWYSRELVDKVKKDLSDLADLQERAKSEESRLAELSASFARMEEEQKIHASGKDGKKIAELKKSLEEEKLQLQKANDEMASLVSPLSKALSRIMKQGSSERLVLQLGDVFEKLRRKTTSRPWNRNQVGLFDFLLRSL